MDNKKYESPFSSRYSSDEMQYLFSPQMKFSTFRRLWVALAKAEKKYGVNITDEQIEELEAHIEDIDFDRAAEYEYQLRHDVMAHIKTYGESCPKAAGIIHLGATSCYVGDNTDIIIMKKALEIVKSKLLRVIYNLSEFAKQYKDLPALAYTHAQPAQLTTVGKRASLWCYDLTLDLCDLDYVADSLCLLGSKGTTGTQASFLEIFDGDGEKCRKAEEYIASLMGFDRCVPVSGQTYTRKFDSRVMNVLCGIAQSAYKFSNDMRLLQSFKEMEEPFEKNQVGSSAMPYKRNPMRCERISALAKYVIADSVNPAMTAGTQWFERTLDDSANKRISMAEAFLAVDGILNIYTNVTSALVVYPKIIERRVMAELPFMASENIMMDAVKRGGNRQVLHEKIRSYAMMAGKRVKEEGLDNNLIELICADADFALDENDVRAHLDPHVYIGRCPEQVDEFIRDVVDPILESNKNLMAENSEIKV